MPALIEFRKDADLRLRCKRRKVFEMGTKLLEQAFKHPETISPAGRRRNYRFVGSYLSGASLPIVASVVCLVVLLSVALHVPPAHSQVVSQATSATEFLTRANIFLKNGKDPRRAPRGSEVSYTSGIGVFHLGNLQAPMATGFLIGRTGVATTAHTFVEGGQWKSRLRARDGGVDLKELQFFVAGCNRSYRVAEIAVRSMDVTGEARSRDVGAAVLREPVCSAAKALPLHVMAPGDLEQLRTLGPLHAFIAGYQPYRRGGSEYGLLLAYGEVVATIADIDGNEIYEVNISTLPGASGGPLLAMRNHLPSVIGINAAETIGRDQDTQYEIDLNLVIPMDAKVGEWLQRFVR